MVLAIAFSASIRPGLRAVCDNCERLLPRSVRTMPPMRPSVGRGRAVRRVPSEPACLRRRRDCLRLPIPDRSPRSPVQVRRGSSTRGVPGRRVGSRGGCGARSGSRPRVAGIRGAAARARVQPGARSRRAGGDEGGRRPGCQGLGRFGTRLPRRDSIAPGAGATCGARFASGAGSMGCGWRWWMT